MKSQFTESNEFFTITAFVMVKYDLLKTSFLYHNIPSADSGNDRVALYRSCFSDLHKFIHINKCLLQMNSYKYYSWNKECTFNINPLVVLIYSTLIHLMGQFQNT